MTKQLTGNSSCCQTANTRCAVHLCSPRPQSEQEESDVRQIHKNPFGGNVSKVFSHNFGPFRTSSLVFKLCYLEVQADRMNGSSQENANRCLNRTPTKIIGTTRLQRRTNPTPTQIGKSPHVTSSSTLDCASTRLSLRHSAHVKPRN